MAILENSRHTAYDKLALLNMLMAKHVLIANKDACIGMMVNTDWLVQIIQHEIDHCDGILI